MHAASTSPADQRAGRVAFATDVVTVQAHTMSKRRTSSHVRLQPGSRSRARASSVACGESTAPVATVRPRRSATVSHRRVGAHDDDRRQVAVGVAHGDRPHADPARFGEPAGAHPGERGVPGHVDPAVEQVLDLALVVRVQDVVERRCPGSRNQRAEAVPDGHDLGVVGDRSQQQPVSLRTLQQRQPAHGPADEVEQRVRRRRHHPRGTRVAEAPLDARAPCGTRPRRRRFIARSVTVGRASPAAALTSSTRSIASSRPSSTAANVSSTQRTGAVGLDPHAGQCRPAGPAAAPSDWSQVLRAESPCRCSAVSAVDRLHQADAQPPRSAPGTRAAPRQRQIEACTVVAEHRVAGHAHASAVTGHDAVAPQPEPVEVDRRREARRVRTGRTTTSSARPPASGRLDQT